MTKRSALVTGGLGGIGRAIVDQFVVRGDCVIVFDCRDLSEKEQRDFAQQGVTYFRVDITDVAAVQNGFTHAFAFLQTQGIASLDILVNNAGITRDTLAVRMKEQDWDTVLAVNLKGAFLCAQHALKKMMRQKKSYVINIASVVGIHGNVGQANYAASKAGLIALTKTLAQEYAGRNVLVNAVAPGFIQSMMTEHLSDEVKQAVLQKISLKRFGAADDVANSVSFLTSGAADYMTGQVIIVDGGLF